MKNQFSSTMMPEIRQKWVLIVLACLSTVMKVSAANCITFSTEVAPGSLNTEMFQTDPGTNGDQRLDNLTKSILSTFNSADSAKTATLLNQILEELRTGNHNNLITSTAQYSVGIYYLLKDMAGEALNWFRLSSSLRDQMKTDDEIQAKCLFNMGLAYYSTGDYRRMAEAILRSVEIEKKLFGAENPRLISGLSSLVTAYLNLNEYNKAIFYGDTALNLIKKADESKIPDIAVLYMNIGVCYTWLSDYSKAKLYFEKAESLYDQYHLSEDINYINLLNSLGATCYFLGMDAKSEEYFNRGFSKIKSSNSSLALNLINSFAIILGDAGKTDKGSKLLLSSLNKAKSFYGEGSRSYFEVLKNYADYLRNYRIDLKKSLQLYEECSVYASNNPDDVQLSNSIMLGYALALDDDGFSDKALKVIQGLLFGSAAGTKTVPETENPDFTSAEPLQWSIKLLRAKYGVLWNIYKKTHDRKYLFSAAATAEAVIGLIDRVRINISEDESRLILGDRFRDLYLFAMRDFDLCYKLTHDKSYLEKAFVYSEKSKVAGLLASTRELKATQFHIPPDIAELERKLKAEISFYEARIENENSLTNPDMAMVTEWKNLVLNSIKSRDSLVKILEDQYPDYYQIKYNSNVVSSNEIPDVVGGKTTYLSYVVSDTVLYIFLKNKKYMQLVTVPIDTAFFNNVTEFRELISYPGCNAKSDFNRFMKSGRILFNTLVEPVEKYFISDRLLISPDNILSYLPFEAMPAGNNPESSSQFSSISYLLEDYRISYTYSATFLAESKTREKAARNKVVAFAPIYTGIINVDSLLGSRQGAVESLSDLPFARTEAQYVTEITKGKLFINDGATESVFKSVAGNYDIIHLAMHTVLNDQYPMYSKMLFYQERDSTDDGNLNTWEVYGLPLKAKMVILSSCNTGNGKLYSGEGILSLARGFVYSGSQSVIMSIWEIEDRSGTEIIKDFYRLLKRGMPKSDALRKARLDYLENADMLRSHPYFWSSLVIYGNNAPLYENRGLSTAYFVLAMMIAAAILLIYSKPR